MTITSSQINQRIFSKKPASFRKIGPLPRKMATYANIPALDDGLMFYCSENHSPPTETVSTNCYRWMCRAHTPVYLFVTADQEDLVKYHHGVSFHSLYPIFKKKTDGKYNSKFKQKRIMFKTKLLYLTNILYCSLKFYRRPRTPLTLISW